MLSLEGGSTASSSHILGSDGGGHNGSMIDLPPGSGVGRSFRKQLDWNEKSEEVADFEAEKAKRGLGTAGMLSGIGVLINTLLGGSSLLLLPRAFAKVGYALSCALMVTCVMLSAIGAHLLHCSAVRLGHAPCSFEACAKLVLPRWGHWIIDATVAIKCFGVAVSCFIIVGDLMPPALHSLFGVSEHMGDDTLRAVCITSSLILATPLACLPRITALKYVSVLTAVIVFFVLVLYILFFLRVWDPCHSHQEHPHSITTAWMPEELSWSTLLLSHQHRSRPCHGASFVPIGGDVESILTTLPQFIFCVTCQHNLFSVCNEVKRSTRKRINTIVVASFLFALTAWTTCGVVSSATMGDRLDSDALKSYPDGGVVEVARLCFCLTQTFVAYPIQIHPCRLSLLALWRMVVRPVENDPRGFRPPHHMPRYWILSVAVLSSTYALSLRFRDIGVVLGIVGATGSTILTYILPGCIYMTVFPGWHAKRCMALLQFALGCIIMPFSLTVIIVTGASGH